MSGHTDPDRMSPHLRTDVVRVQFRSGAEKTLNAESFHEARNPDEWVEVTTLSHEMHVYVQAQK